MNNKLLEIDVFKLFSFQGRASPNAVALAVLGINPYAAVKDIPEEHSKNVDMLRRAIVNNVNAVNPLQDTRTNTDVDSDIVFGATYPYVCLLEGSIPEIIKSRIEQALNNIYTKYKNDEWKTYIHAFGGQELVQKIAMQNKKGQGQYRKNDEQKGTYKLIGLLVLLLQEKTINGCQPSNNYGSIGKPNKKRIYEDIKELVDGMNEDLLADGMNKDFLGGVGSSTFYDKLRDADYYLNESDEQLVHKQ
ncbi:hypothetical protein KKJ09_06410 [Xenorhabdus bovienii]|uniref:hypothetical protein n=1 Tax=Xenorhabdus bovienii TaxID=40576 RepID=UPI0023B32193|nr:hypothetical protein [Xenorhabdus bovienii]MDE9493240.1 hypothetical protein [Xenorhabdus bovienii]MDE9501776.1 hypothetical protein [Xenorhabdus bovienii]MDE9525560.1 hypothetical protein [Xenorhabdus bovienii]MDE9568003.1 hypothetical protein [Xenorhabdus bovienii]